MSWKMTKHPETMLANSKLVEEFVNMEPAPYDRPLSERRMMVYERLLKMNAFRPVVWASAVCHETNMTYRVNGKHTSTLLSRLPELPKFHVTVERYSCETLADVAALYGTFDSNLSNRNSTDINASFAAAVPEFAGIPMRIINLAVASVSYHKWNDTELRKVPHAERAEQLLDHIGFVKWLREIVSTVDTKDRNSLCKHLVRTSVVSAMFATYDRGPVIAKQFWTAVRDESAADRNDATRTLARFLVRAVIGGNRGKGGGERNVVSLREMYVKCLHAWNAWRKGETTNLSYYPNSDVPAVSK